MRGVRNLWSHRQFFKGSPARLTAGIGAAVAEAVMVIPIPWLVARAIDRALPDHNRSLLAWYVVGILVCAALAMILSIAASAALVTVTRAGTARLRSRCTTLLIGASRQFHTDSDETALHDILVTDAARVDEMASVVVGNVLPALLTLVAMAIALTIVNPLLALVTALLVPLIIVTHIAFRTRRGRATAAFHNAYERFSSGVLNVLRSDEMIRIEGAHEAAQSEQDHRIAHLEETGRAAIVLNSAHDSAQLMVVSLVAATILLIGGTMVINNELKIGELVSFYAAFGLLRRPIAYLASATAIINTGALALTNVDAFLEHVDQEPYIGTDRIEQIETLEMRDVSFGYPERAPIVDHLSMHIAHGEMVGLAGPNGSGKSTVVHLLLGLYRPHDGVILLNGTPYDDLDVRALRRAIGVVPQHPVFLAASIAENLHIRPEHTRDTSPEAKNVHDALRLSGAQSVIDSLPNGLETHIGDDGVRLSGGQRQRLAIARALIRQPQLLILDEPTLHLDTASVELLLDVLHREHGPAVLVVSHQTMVFAHADRVVTFS